MINKNLKTMKSKLVCPECKNDVDLSRYPNIVAGMIVECDKCGMTLSIKEIADDGEVKTQIVDEGK
jgi:ribosomal protein L37AE/L43A